MSGPLQSPMEATSAGGRTHVTFGIAVAAIVILLDQLTKYWLVVTMDAIPGRTIEVTPFFTIVEWMNKGVSFGLFNNGDGRLNGIVFSLVAAAIVIALLIWLWRAGEWLIALAIGLVIGGAIGNVADRLRLGAVVDFLDFHWGLWHFPAFNAADSAICVGVGLMVIDGLLVRREKSN